MVSELTFLEDEEHFAAIDREFGRFAARHAQGGDKALTGILAAMVSQARGEGHSCLELAQVADKTWPSEDAETQYAFPPLEHCVQLLKKSPFVGDGSKPTPLVLEGQRLFLFRYWHAERVLSAFIRTAFGVHPSPENVVGLKASFQELFGPFASEPDWQAVAAFAATVGSFTLITGGPGTGKTTTVVRMLAALLNMQPQLKIAIAAPTGKAVARLTDALRGHAGRLPPTLAELLPKKVQTLHRLLGYQPHRDQFTYDRKRHLSHDLIIIDEASMVDVLLMANLVEAMQPNCRLILLGDHQQLASVDAGNILADLCQAADPWMPHSQHFAKTYAELTGQNLPVAEAPVPPLRDRLVLLRRSHRFNENAGLGALSKAIRSGDAAQTLALLHDKSQDDIHLEPLPSKDESLQSLLAPYIESIRSATNLKEAFDRFNRLRLLTGMREGRFGVNGLNAFVEQFLKRRGVSFFGNGYHGRPIIVTRNDYRQQLFNGDIGLCWQTDGQPLRAHFPQDDGGFRSIPLLKLPAVESAWALTVHKSQGSEFEDVYLMLPPEEHPLCRRELLYTGITRARRRAVLFGDHGQVQYAVDHTTSRHSGLVDRLLAQS